jgi:hypothetical protein
LAELIRLTAAATKQVETLAKRWFQTDFEVFYFPFMSITHFTVFGERCSGTNHAVAWIEKNLGLKHRADFGWKHAAIDLPKLKKEPDILCVLVVRNLPDWLRSLHIKPHHLSPEMRGLPFPLFIKRSVHSVFDHTMGVSPRDAKFGVVMPGEQHQAKPYANLIRMRRHKHRVWLKQLANLPHAVVLRHEDLLHQPALVLQKLLTLCNLPSPPSQSLHEVSQYKGKEGAQPFQPNAYAPICSTALQHILEQLDWEMETQLGYDAHADLQAARRSEQDLQFDALREALVDQPKHLSILEEIAQRLEDQGSQLRHQELVSQSQRKYLISLFHAIERSRSKFSFWPWSWR